MTEHRPATTTETATLAGGCFWCLEAVYDDIEGVLHVESGYSGGKNANPTYQQVCSGTTGHAEVVQITFDPTVLSYRELLEIFFSIHDPTTRDRQGNDVGTQYRSAIFYHNDEQKTVAQEMIKELQTSGKVRAPVVTEVVPYTTFYEAEDYHQEYFANNASQPYCAIVVAPKVQKAHKLFPAKIRS